MSPHPVAEAFDSNDKTQRVISNRRLLWYLALFNHQVNSSLIQNWKLYDYPFWSAFVLADVRPYI